MVLNVMPNEESSSPEGAGSGESCGNGLEKIYPTTAVRYGQMAFVGEFTHAKDLLFTCGGKVVIQTKRGIEIGEQVSLTCGGCSHSVTREQLQAYLRASGPAYCALNSGRILREATADDLFEYDRILAGAQTRRRTCQEMAHAHKLDMRMVSCEPLFGGERIIFYFMSEGRVDFRGLVRDLAHEFQTRIELRQVGARDEARLVADYETCGRECCCKNFLKTLKPVNMKMAKMQKATLDPSKVSGRCGRLKCCLRYEHTAYEELDRTLPKFGAQIRTRQGEGRVVGRQILTQLVQIATQSGGRLVVPIEDILKPGEEMEAPKPPPEPAATPEPTGETAQPDTKPRSRGRGRGGRRRTRREPLERQAEPSGQPAPAEPAAPATGDQSPATGAGRPAAENTGAKRKRRKRRRGRDRPRPPGTDHGQGGGEKRGGQPPASAHE